MWLPGKSLPGSPRLKLLCWYNQHLGLLRSGEFLRKQFLEESVIGEEVLDDIKDEDELQCDFEDLNEKPILNLNEVKVNLINEKTRYDT